VVSDYWVYHCEYFLLIDLWIVPQAVFRSTSSQFGEDRFGQIGFVPWRSGIRRSGQIGCVVVLIGEEAAASNT
jgi:hypothetical protein